MNALICRKHHCYWTKKYYQSKIYIYWFSLPIYILLIYTSDDGRQSFNILTGLKGQSGASRDPKA